MSALLYEDAAFHVNSHERPPVSVFLYWKPFQRGLQAKSLCEAFRRVQIYIAADLRRNPHQTLDTHIYFKFPGSASAL